MKTISLVSALALAWINAAHPLAARAATNLAPGDIYLIGARADTPDRFAFVTWVDLQAGTQLGFTDGSYRLNGNFNGAETFATWQAPTYIPAGTVIVATDTGLGPETYDLGSTLPGSTGRLSGLSMSGDQIFVYQRNDGTVGAASPFNSASTVTAHFNSGYELLFGLNIANPGFIASGTASSSFSYVPDANSGAGPLVYGATALSFPANNMQYTGSRTGLTVSQFKAAVLNANNWQTVTPTGLLSSADFAVIPEPSVALTLCCGLGVLFILRRRE